LVVVLPLLVIVCSVAVVAADPGQFVPFARHTDEPFTAMAEAFKVVPEAVAKPNQEVEVPLVRLSEPIVPDCANKLVEEAVEAKKLVVVTAVNVAFVPVSAASEVAPSTVKVEVTVDEDVIKPPSKYNSLVVVAPVLLTVCKLGVVPEGQFVPSDKHTVVLLINVLLGRRA
jgi:hypothetical protein